MAEQRIHRSGIKKLPAKKRRFRDSREPQVDRPTTRERRACLEKTRFTSRAAAQFVADSQPGLRVYKCPFCDGYHLSSHQQANAAGITR